MSLRTFANNQRLSVLSVREASTITPAPGIARTPLTLPFLTRSVWSESVMSNSTPSALARNASSPAGAFHTPRASPTRAYMPRMWPTGGTRIVGCAEGLAVGLTIRIHGPYRAPKTLRPRSVDAYAFIPSRSSPRGGEPTNIASPRRSQ